MLVDTHAHLDILENLGEVLVRAKQAGVGKIITIGTSIESSQKAVEIAEKYTSGDIAIFAAVGVHPFDGKSEVEELGVQKVVGAIDKIAQSSKKVVAIGECGLDYFEAGGRQKETTKAEKLLQRKLFGAQITLSEKLKLPLVVHCRKAWDEIFSLLASGWKLRNGVVFHSFTGNSADAQVAAALGFLVSFSGIVSFKNAKDIQAAAAELSIDKILVETDSPYLTPEPFRGQKNEPANVKITADFLSNLRSVSYEDFCVQTSNNAEKLFKLW